MGRWTEAISKTRSPGPHESQLRDPFLRRQVGVINAWSAAEAVIEYLRSRGFGDQDIVRLGVSAASWRGAVFTATRLDDVEL
jgi:hypothetical protein